MTSKIEYIKGLVDGMDISDNKMATIIANIIDAMEDMADELDEIQDHVIMIDEDLQEVEDYLVDCCECDCDECECEGYEQ